MNNVNTTVDKTTILPIAPLFESSLIFPASTRRNPTIYQRRFRLAAALTGRKAIDKTGLVKYDGRLVPPMAAEVGRSLKGRRFAPKKPPRVPEVLEKFRTMCEEIGEAFESAKVLNRDLIPELLEAERKKKIPKLLLWQRLEDQRNKEKRKKKTAS